MTLFELDDRIGASMTDLEFSDWVAISGQPFHEARLELEQAQKKYDRIQDVYSKMHSGNFKQLMAHITPKEDA